MWNRKMNQNYKLWDSKTNQNYRIHKPIIKNYRRNKKNSNKTKCNILMTIKPNSNLRLIHHHRNHILNNSNINNQLLVLK